jgi:para-nitrobenzyl esterase
MKLLQRTLDRRRLLAHAGQFAAAFALRGMVPAALIGNAHAKFMANADPKAIVETSAGKIRGGIADGIHIFRGIPYGAPTGGANRFQPPASPAKWTGVRDALNYGDISPQPGAIAVGGGGTPTRALPRPPAWPTPQSEDCLNLSVWTPSVNGRERRPVIVWLHGGGFETGSGNSAVNEGTNLARRGDVVVVAVNHRLGPVGYLHLAELGGAELAHSGNVGMLDIVLALRWVRDNIGAFGGDPGNVMIHGESGGGRKVSTMLALPGAKGLFHRAAIQSGAGLKFPTNETQTKRAFYLLQQLGLGKEEAHKLKDVPIDKLVAAGAAASAKLRSEFPEGAPLSASYGFAPVIGPDLPRAPFDPAAPDVSADVPVLIGTNRHEMAYSFGADPKFDEVDETALLEQARIRVGERAATLLDVYRQSYPQASRRVLMLLLASDFSHRMDSLTLAERKHAQQRAPVYMYRFDWESPVLDGAMLAAHTYEIPHVFDNAQLCGAMTGGGPDAVALAAKMSEAWIAFARRGNPGHAGLPAWPSYDIKTRATMLFNDVCEVAKDPGGAERLAWEELRRSTGF